LTEWPQIRTEQANAAFERAATEALRAPVLAERSVVLRRVAKYVVPKSARPLARRFVGRVDALSRRITDAVNAAR
jgi:hypothetical protein